MKIREEEANEIRDLLHNLDINNSTLDRELYNDKLYYIISSGEGFSKKVYKDTKGKRTIGYGFNMDRGCASKMEWDNTIGKEVSFDDAINGKISITKEQARMLKKFGVDERTVELSKLYKPYWNNIRANERAIITDMYYQSPKLVGKGTNFMHQVKEYYRTAKVSHLNAILYEIEENSSHSSNLREIRGLKNRNKIRAIIFDSKKSFLYSKPDDEIIPKDKTIYVTIGKTVIPKIISDNVLKSGKKTNYYIWRTQKDHKVRLLHRLLEGKVFIHGEKVLDESQMYNCRCDKEDLPINAEIIRDDEYSNKMLEEIETQTERNIENMVRQFHGQEDFFLQSKLPKLKMLYSTNGFCFI